ncbi:ankyrin repeat-containing domain protein [Xylariaceae sp. FL0594]|nr:ankyrin repeat-containing domain protein [Xylariaceae sp. FL0594]
MSKLITTSEANAIFATLQAPTISSLESCVDTVSRQKKLAVGQVLALAQDADGCTVLHIAAMHGLTSVLEYYDRHFALQPGLYRGLLNERNKMRDTPLHFAAKRSQTAFIIALHSRMGDNDTTTNNNKNNFASTPGAFGFTALHYAARASDTDLCAFLVRDMGADADARSLSGDTALHLAAHADDLDTVARLLALGASPEVTNCAGRRPVVVDREGAGVIIVASLPRHIERRTRRAYPAIPGP